MGFDDAGLTVLLQACPSVAIRARGLDDGGDCRSDDARLILKKDFDNMLEYHRQHHHSHP